MSFGFQFRYCKEGHLRCLRYYQCNERLIMEINELDPVFAQKFAEQHVSEYNGVLEDFYEIPREVLSLINPQ